VKPGLPQPFAACLSTIEPSPLPEAFHEVFEIRRLRPAGHEQVRVIGHQAVRNDVKVQFAAGEQDLRYGIAAERMIVDEDRLFESAYMRWRSIAGTRRSSRLEVGEGAR
jgi:hypothetical protein